jgi:TolA-binding protein
MCGSNKRFFLYLLFGLLFAFAAGALRAEEPGRWHLISEPELGSIEDYRNRSEAEKRDWLLQVQRLKAQANSLREESESLNSQLSEQRELNRGLQKSFNEYEAGQLTRISLKNGEIAGLKQKLAERTLEAESYKGKAVLRLVIIIALLAGIAGYAAFRVCRFFRLI